MLCDKRLGFVMSGVFGGQACSEFAERVGGTGGVDGAAACEGLAGDGAVGAAEVQGARTGELFQFSVGEPASPGRVIAVGAASLFASTSATTRSTPGLTSTVSNTASTMPWTIFTPRENTSWQPAASTTAAHYASMSSARAASSPTHSAPSSDSTDPDPPAQAAT